MAGYIRSYTNALFQEFKQRWIILSTCVFLVGIALSMFAITSVWIRLVVAVCSLILFLFLLLVVAPYKAWRTSQSTLKRLETEAAPTLDIRFDGRQPFIYDNYGTNEIGERLLRWRLCRIEVFNTSKSRAIDNVKVLLDIDPPSGASAYPAPLHIMHDNPNPGDDYKRTVKLNPWSGEYWDVVERHANLHVMHFQCPISPRHRELVGESARRTLKIIASGDGCRTVYRRFRAQFDDNFLLSFSPLDDVTRMA